MSPKRASFSLRFTALVTLLTFSSQQVSQAQNVQQELPAVSKSFAVSSVEESPLKPSVRSPEAPGNFVREAVDFFENDNPLRRVESAAITEKALKSSAQETAKSLEPEDGQEISYEQERKSFEEAFAELRPEYASAVILESLSEENVRQLLALDFETAIVILAGEIVLLTSGSEDEILTNKPAARILESAAFTSHTHPRSGHMEGPSPVDLKNASGREYVLTDRSVYAYDSFGSEEVTLDLYFEEFEVALKAERERYHQNSMMARQQLNRFIKEMDLLNASQLGRLSFRASDELPTFQDDFSVSTTLTQNWTVVKGGWVLSAAQFKHVLTTWSPDTSKLIPEAANPYSGLGILKNQTAVSNMEAQGVFNFTNLQQQDVRGVIVRYQDAQNYYLGAYRRNGKYQLIRVQNDVWTVIAESAAPVVAAWNEWLTIKVRVEGNQLSLYSNGALKLQAVDSAFSTGRAGVYSNYQGSVDDFKYWVLGGATPPVVQAPIVAAPPAYTKSTPISLSGTKQAGTSIWIDGVERVSANASTSWSYNQALAPGDGVKNFSVLAKDAAGNASSAVNVSTTLDQTLPAGSVSLQAGAAYTSSTAVTAALTASDALSGIDQVRFQVNGVWGAWENFSASKSLTLPSGDGSKTVLYEVRDKALNVRQVSGAIVLDTTLPTLSLTVNSGNAYTKTVSVPVSLTASDAGSGMFQMRYQLAGGSWSAWETYAAAKQVTLPAGDGSKEIRFEVKDKAGNVKSAAGSVTLDTAAPVIVIQSPAIGAETFVISENQLTVQYSVDGQVKTKQFNALSTGDNPLSLQETDLAGNVTTRNFTIRVVPSVSVAVPTAAALPAFTNQSVLLLTGTKQAGTSLWINGVERVAANASTNWSYSQPLSGDGVKNFSILAKDASGNASSPLNVTTTLDQTLPAGAMSLNAGADYSASTAVTAALTASDALSGLDKVRYQVNGVWGNWENFAASKALTLSAGDGTKTAVFEVRDKAGNVSSWSDTIVLDTTAPSLSLEVNYSSAYTKALSVPVVLTGSDAGSGLSQMRYQAAGGAWSSWETFASLKQVTLPSGDGSKEIRFEVKDLAGNVKSAAGSVTLDTVAPVVDTDSPYFKAQTAETGLSGYWDFDAVAGNGTADQSGRSNNGILVNGPAASADVPPLTTGNDGSLSFDGVNDYVTTSNPITSPNTFSLSLWFKTSSAGGRLIGFGQGQTGDNWNLDRHLFMGDWGHLYFGVYSGGIQLIQTPQAYNDGKWHHVAASMSSSGMALYVDGQLKAQKANVTSAGVYQGYWRLGGDNLYNWWNRPYNYYFKGNMDEARVYDRQLSPQEIQTLAQGGTLGASAPPAVIQTSSLTIDYKLDGAVKSKTFTGLAQGENVLRISENDAAGNNTTLLGRVTVNLPDRTVLADSTELFRTAGILQRELTPWGDEIFYRADGSVEKYRFADGREILYSAGAPQVLLFYNAQGALQETLNRPSALQAPKSEWVRVSLAGGLTAFYSGEVLQELLTETGIRLTNLTFDTAGSIQDGLIFYPDGTVDVIRASKRLRHFDAEGTVLDYLPSGAAVREIFPDHTDYYRFEKTSQTGILKTRVTASTGNAAVYDDKGLLSEVHKGTSALYYDRQSEGDQYRLLLNRGQSSVPDAKTLVEGLFNSAGQPLWIALNDGTRIYYETGRLDRVVDAAGQAVDYDFEMADGFVTGLTVSRRGTSFQYAADGFLDKIETSAGTVTRNAVDTNHDGKLTDEQIVDILLDEAGGNSLTDFQLDADGKIVNGIITTKEGIKQKIQNSVLTGYETVDGKLYTIQAGANGVQEARLAEWKFKDGTKAVYGGGSITQILFPDGRSLKNLAFGSDRTLKTYVEELADGTRKSFENGKLKRITTVSGAIIVFGTDGMAEKVIFPGGEEQAILYQRDTAGQIEQIVFKGPHASRTFDPQGDLQNVLTRGVRAELNGGELERLFTRYGLVEDPQFSQSGLLSGSILFSDGIQQVISEGVLSGLVLPGGSRLSYAAGRIQTLTTAEGLYRILYAEQSGALQSASLQFSGTSGTWTTPLVPYLLDHPDFELNRFLLSRPLYNSVEDAGGIRSEFETGDTLLFAKISQDSERGSVIEVNSDSVPVWANISNGYSSYDTRFMEAAINITDQNDALPSTTAQLTDFNGDGFLDRVFMQSTAHDYWWVQWGDGLGFSSPVKWSNVQMTEGYAYTRGLRYYEGRHPHVLVEMRDVNGDGWQDRILQDFGRSNTWSVQINNKTDGFSAPVLWTGIQPLSQYAVEGTYAIQARDDAGNKGVQNLISDLIDMDGDGLPDRVVRPGTGNVNRWFFQKNTGTGFEPAVLWEGVDTSFDSDPMMAASLSWYQTVTNNKNREVVSVLEDFIFRWKRDYKNNNTCPGGGQRLPCLQAIYNTFSQEFLQIQNTYSIQPWADAFTGSYLTTENLEKVRDAVSRVFGQLIGDKAVLEDLNGDLRPDRILVKPTGEWYWQRNNGTGFEPAALWDAAVRVVTDLPGGSIGASIHLFNGYERPRDVLVDLVDVTGDGLPDRVSVDRNPSAGTVNNVWWVEVNTGTSFAPASAWAGIYGNNSTKTSITQDLDNFRSNDDFGVAGEHGRSPHMGTQSTSLRDVNGDRVADRLIYEGTENKWLVQYGTGSGFLPVTPLHIDALEAPSAGVLTSRYDYLHVSLKAASVITPAQGKLKITLGDPSEAESYQVWEVTDLAAVWKDLYLPLNSSKENAERLKIEFVPASGTVHIPVFIDNVTFTALRPPAEKDWLDRLLAEENVLSEVYSDRNQTLAGYLGYVESGSEEEPFSRGLLESLMNAETRLAFDAAGSLQEFETFYGSVSLVENGRVSETVLPNGNKVEFSAPSTQNPQSAVRTVTDAATGQTVTQELSYGRVRQVTRSGKPPLQYSYEFDALGREIAVILDPDTGVIERYRDIAGNSRILSRTEANSVVTEFLYNDAGVRTESRVSYKGRVYETYHYGESREGLTTVTTESGVIEEYDSEGTIRYHTTADGYRYSHNFENARKVQMSTETETALLADGSSLTVVIPKVALQDCLSECERVHRVSLTGFTREDGTEAGYQNGGLTSLKFADGTQVFFTKTVIEEKSDPSTGDGVPEIRLLDASVIHPDGTATEYREGKPFSVRGADGSSVSLETEQGLLINPNESARFHYAQAMKLWTDVVQPEWMEFLAPGVLALEMDYDPEGQLVTRRYAEGVTEIFEEGRILMTVGADGERMTDYEYDAEGNPVKVTLEASRRRLEASVLKLKAEVAMERQKALSKLAEREQVLNQTIEGEYIVQRDRLLAIRAKIEAQKNYVASLQVKGKTAKAVLGDAAQQIQAGLDQVNAALERHAQNRIDALEQLSAQVMATSTEIENDTAASYSEIAGQETLMKSAILRHEVSPVIYHWYRKILGRDPSKADYDLWISRTNYQTGVFDLSALKNDLLQSPELTQRTAEVNFIKSAVNQDLLHYLSLSEEGRAAFAAELGVSPDKLVSLNTAEADSLLAWINSRSLHFGQSAYVALEALLMKAGIAFERRELARRLILVDILTGTLTPMEQGDLLISMFALKTVAGKYGLSAEGYGLNFESLKALYDKQCQAAPDTCQFRVIAHVDGNHYIVITKVTADEITYIETGSATTLNQDIDTMTKEEFLSSWLDASNPAAQFGYIFSAQPPPEAEFSAGRARILDNAQLMKVRGAFFIVFIIAAVIAVAQAVAATVAAVVAAIAAIVSAVAAGIGSILSGFGSLFSGLFSGQFLTGLQGLFHGITAGIGKIAGAVFKGVVAFGKTFTEVYALTGTALNGVKISAAAFLKSFAASSFVKGTLIGAGIGMGLQGVGKLLEVMGFAPKISQTLVAGGKIIIGAALVSSGNLAGLGLLGGGSDEFLSLHTNLSPAMSGIIGIGASALTAFAGGVGNLSGLAALKAAVPHLSMDLASSGLTALGDALKLDPRITALASVPLRAAIGNGIGNVLNVKGYESVLKNITRDSLAGFVSVGSSLGLDFLGAPVSVSQYVGQLLGAVAYGPSAAGEAVTNSVSKAIENLGKSLFSKLSEGFSAFGNVVKRYSGPILSLGNKVLQETGQFSESAFKKTLNSFSFLFGKKTQEYLYQDLVGLRQGQVTIEGENWVWRAGDEKVIYNTGTGKTTNVSGFMDEITISGLGSTESGETAYEKLTYESVLEEGMTRKQTYEKGILREIAVYYRDIDIAKITSSLPDGIAIDSNAAVLSGDVRTYQPQEILLPPDFPRPEGDEVRPYIPAYVRFETKNGWLVDGVVEVQKREITAGPQKELFVLTNGILSPEMRDAPSYLKHLESDIVKESGATVGSEDILLAHTFHKIQLLNFLSFTGYVNTIQSALTGAFGSMMSVVGGAALAAIVDFSIGLTKDLAAWAAEVADPVAHAAVATDIRTALELYFQQVSAAQRDRDIVAVGYSGGFLPLVEVLNQEPKRVGVDSGYKTKSVVAIGAATIGLKDILLKVIEAGDKIRTGQASIDFLKSLSLDFFGGAFQMGDFIRGKIAQFLANQSNEDAYQEYKRFIDALNLPVETFAQSSLLGTAAEMVVNVYGTKDVLADLKFNGVAIGGFRSDMLGYSTQSPDKTLFNIEISNAGHNDYIRNDIDDGEFAGVLGVATGLLQYKDPFGRRAWNDKVSSFVAQLINAAKTKSDLNAFLSREMAIGRITKMTDRWVVNL